SRGAARVRTGRVWGVHGGPPPRDLGHWEALSLLPVRRPRRRRRHPLPPVLRVGGDRPAARRRAFRHHRGRSPAALWFRRRDPLLPWPPGRADGHVRGAHGTGPPPARALRGPPRHLAAPPRQHRPGPAAARPYPP